MYYACVLNGKIAMFDMLYLYQLQMRFKLFICFMTEMTVEAKLICPHPLYFNQNKNKKPSCR